MIKITGKLPKITENSRNLQENSLKNAKNSPLSFARRIRGGFGFAGQGGVLPNFSMTGEVLLTPLWPCLLIVYG